MTLTAEPNRTPAVAMVPGERSDGNGDHSLGQSRKQPHHNGQEERVLARLSESLREDCTKFLKRGAYHAWSSEIRRSASATRGRPTDEGIV